MTRRWLRPVAAALIAPFWVFVGAFASPHAHEFGGHASQTVVHSHFAPHHLSSHHSEVAEIESSGEHIVWLDDAVASVTASDLYSPAAIIAGHVEPAPFSSSWSVVAFDEGAPAHGPPRRALSPRGPPNLLA